MTPGPQSGKGTGGNGNGNGAGGFDDFDDFIRDREDEFGESWDNPRAGYDPYDDYARSQSSARQPGIDRGLVDAITRILEGLAGVAGGSLSPETRKQMEKALRDLLVVLRDVIDAMIERIDNRRDDDFEIEEIPID